MQRKLASEMMCCCFLFPAGTLLPIAWYLATLSFGLRIWMCASFRLLASFAIFSLHYDVTQCHTYLCYQPNTVVVVVPHRVLLSFLISQKTAVSTVPPHHSNIPRFNFHHIYTSSEMNSPPCSLRT